MHCEGGFLALLDYVSRAHEIAICLSSVVRPSVSQLSLNLIYGFLSNFSCGFPLSRLPPGTLRNSLVNSYWKQASLAAGWQLN